MKKYLIAIFIPIILLTTSVSANDFKNAVDAYGRKDYKVAFSTFKYLAEQGNMHSQYILGSMYLDGQGVAQNYKEAVKWYRLSAEQGEAEAQHSLGLSYSLGRGGPLDYKEAVRWYRMSATKGSARAQSNLGAMYVVGKGVALDYVEAHKWFNIAGANGLDEGRKFRDKIEKRMTHEQIDKAQRLAKEWMIEHEK